MFGTSVCAHVAFIPNFKIHKFSTANGFQTERLSSPAAWGCVRQPWLVAAGRGRAAHCPALPRWQRCFGSAALPRVAQRLQMYMQLANTSPRTKARSETIPPENNRNIQLAKLVCEHVNLYLCESRRKAKTWFVLKYYSDGACRWLRRWSSFLPSRTKFQCYTLTELPHDSGCMSSSSDSSRRQCR